VINGSAIVINGSPPLNIRNETGIETIDIQPIEIGQPITVRNPEKHDLYCEISPAAMIYQRGRLERSQKLVISDFVPYD
jgi:hypothetical protein